MIQVHVFQAFGSLAAKSREALDSAATFIRSHIGRSPALLAGRGLQSTTTAAASLFVAVAAL
jgi:hypothetical protein